MKEYIFQISDALYNEETGEAVFQPIVAGELVRCKDCKYMQEHSSYNISYWTCSKWHNATNYDGYCHYGERTNCRFKEEL